MVSASSAQLVAELNRVASRMDRAWLVAVLTVAAVVTEWFQPVVPFWVIIGTAVLGVALTLYARHTDVTRGTVVLHYDLGGEGEARFDALKAAFAEFGGCQGVWHITARGDTDDWKRNAGANALIERSAIRPFPSIPSRVNTNVEAPMLLAGRQRVYFFPDQVFVYDGSRVGAVGYPALRVTADTTQFIEQQTVPSDAQVVGSTWRYVNKSGGPDRRFNDNREIPIMLYGQLRVESDTGLREHFSCSRPEAAQRLADAITGYGGLEGRKEGGV